jgi:hypothetical protein
MLGSRQVRLVGLQQGVTTRMAARRPKHGGDKPCSGYGTAVASQLTSTLVSTSPKDAKTRIRSRGGERGRAGHDERKLGGHGTHGCGLRWERSPQVDARHN